MPPASSSNDRPTAVSRPMRRASRGANGANAPKQSTGTVVSSPARAAESPVSARRSRSTGATATTAGRWLSATATIATRTATVAARVRVPRDSVVRTSFIAPTPPHAGDGRRDPPVSPLTRSDRVRGSTEQRGRMSILGTRVVRTEDPLFLTRGATYTDDLVDERLAGALHVTFVRSQVAHGRVLSVDASAAREVPGVVAVLTAADLDDLEPIPSGLPMVPEAMV